jgi:hypothetical protein
VSLDGTAPAGHHGLSVMELAAARSRVMLHLDLLGTVLGNLLVEDSGTACVRGVVAEAVINRGGVVEIYGSVGRPRPGPSDPQL